MSGRRCRALAAEFLRIEGRLPHNGGMVRGTYHESERRRLKKAYRLRRRRGGIR